MILKIWKPGLETHFVVEGVEDFDVVGNWEYSPEYRKVLRERKFCKSPQDCILEFVTDFDDYHSHLMQTWWEPLGMPSNPLERAAIQNARTQEDLDLLRPCRRRKVGKIKQESLSEYTLSVTLPGYEYSEVFDAGPYVSFESGENVYFSQIKKELRAMCREALVREGKDLTEKLLPQDKDKFYFDGESRKIYEVEVRVNGQVRRYFFDTEAVLLSDEGERVSTLIAGY